jgi:hypothetical protein
MRVSRTTAAAAVLWAVALAIYLPQAGHGFVQDDFRWIVESRVASLGEVPRLFFANVGFYRPLVSLSFAIDYALWGTDAFGYALTNVAFYLLAAALLYLLARRFGLTPAAAVATMAVWMFNFSGVNMALLWLSGRTALLVTVFSLLCTHAVVRRRYWVAAAMSTAAVLCKEEAVVLPLFFAIVLVASERRLAAAWKTVPMWTGLAAYLLLRSHSGAFWPADAPSYYRLSFAPGLLLRNFVEYADRSATVALIVAVAFALVGRIRPADFNADERRVLTFAIIWLPAMFGLTVFLPVRSSLYALLPSVGSALIAGVFAAVAQRTHQPRFDRTAAVMIVLVVLLTPVYRARNVRWVKPAELTEQVMTTLVRDLRNAAPGRVVVIDDPAERFNLTTAFGGLFQDALLLRLGKGWSGDVVTDTAAVTADHTYRLSDGVLTRQR